MAVNPGTSGGKKAAAAIPAAKKVKADAAVTAERQENKRLAAKRLAAAVEKIAKAVDDAVDYAAELVAKQKQAVNAFENIQKKLATL
ncbi:hypothetical protein DL768_003923 [Monosporascus sp. mg162]|nr:hypothetical protein DL768_003923 [Monosporascus sp. mg162]